MHDLIQRGKVLYRGTSEWSAQQITEAHALEGLAKELGVSLTHLSLAWCAKNPHVSTVILGASKVAQLKDNLRALDTLPKLTAEVMGQIERIVQNKPAEPEDFK